MHKVFKQEFSALAVRHFVDKRRGLRGFIERQTFGQRFVAFTRLYSRRARLHVDVDGNSYGTTLAVDKFERVYRVYYAFGSERNGNGASLRAVFAFKHCAVGYNNIEEPSVVHIGLLKRRSVVIRAEPKRCRRVVAADNERTEIDVARLLTVKVVKHFLCGLFGLAERERHSVRRVLL